MLAAVSSKHSLSVLLSAVVMSHTTRTALMLAVDRRHKLIAYMCGVYNSPGYNSKAVFEGSVRFSQSSLLGDYYSKAPYCVASI